MGDGYPYVQVYVLYNIYKYLIYHLLIYFFVKSQDPLFKIYFF